MVIMLIPIFSGNPYRYVIADPIMGATLIVKLNAIHFQGLFHAVHLSLLQVFLFSEYSICFVCLCLFMGAG